MGGITRPRARFVMLAATAPLTLLGACSQTDSKDLRTSGVQAYIKVQASADGADGLDVIARLTTGGLNSVDLTGDDELTVTAGGRTRTLQHREAFKQDDYRTHVDLDGFARAGLPVTVGLRRGAGDTSAPASTVQLPAELRVTAPVSGSSHRRSADLVVGTSAGAGNLSVAWKGSCVLADSLRAEPGEPLVIPANRMVRAVAAAPATSASGASAPSAAPAPPKECAVTLTVTRTVTGELDDHFESGSIEANRSAALAIRSTP